MKPRSLALLLGGLLLGSASWTRADSEQLLASGTSLWTAIVGGAGAGLFLSKDACIRYMRMDAWHCHTNPYWPSQTACEEAKAAAGPIQFSCLEIRSAVVVDQPSADASTARPAPRPRQIIVGPDGEPSFVYDWDAQPSQAPGR